MTSYEKKTVMESSPTSSPAVGSSYSGQLYSYLYNGAASVSNALSGETKLADDVPCFVNGLCYKGPRTSSWASEAVRRCCPYFTYRKHLPSTLSNGGDHDAGWGCMIRTGQMMMCQSLRRLYRCDLSITVDSVEFAMFQKVSVVEASRASPTASNSLSAKTAPNFLLDLDAPTATPTLQGDEGPGATFYWVQEFFMDTPQAPFGVYKLANEGAKWGVPVGSWFSPTVLARSLAALGRACPDINERLEIVAALEQTVSQEDTLRTLVSEERSLLLLVPLMLGMGSIAKGYEQVVLKLLEMPACVGIVGGKPQKSLYFMGHQREQVFFLDPHVVQPAFTSRSSVGKLGGPRGTTPVSSLDPNLLACFFFENEESFLQWCDDIAAINKLGEFPIITIQSSSDSKGPSSLSVFQSSPRTSCIDPCDFDEEDLL
jgi:cysteine protease ATG4